MNAAQECAKLLRDMADDIEKDERGVIDFLAFFHVHPMNDSPCGVIPIGMIVPDGHLLDWISQFFEAWSDDLIGYRDNDVTCMVRPITEDGVTKYQVAYFDKPMES